MNLNGVDLIRELSLAFGPSGCEDDVRELIRPRAEAVADKVSVDRMGDLIAKMSFGDANAKDRKRIMISAHMDEVGFMISDIREDGMLAFGCVGGIDPSVLAGRKVFVKGSDKLIRGVICSKAIHHKSPEERERPLAARKLYIDIGAEKKDVASELLAIGDFATFDSEFYEFGKGGRTLKSKALDDRMGCAAMLEMMDKFKAAPPTINADVYFCFTVREEIGFSGAECVANIIRPDFAVILETTAIGDLPETEACRRVADVGKGGVISVADRSTIYQREVVDFALDLAKEKGIPAQIKRYVSGGNDAGHIHKSTEGVKVLAISVPTRYLHSPACVASLDDYESVRDLCEQIIRNSNEI
jgi:endoglucanase